ncbi:hypothetical protein AGDE_13911 [Angomonas deanei]|uniref:Uncharacterized protein n=1 Tax=Angomonas deanei TaxID=59799 RepID=A0A7G2CP91_9TRYP|nr:hypothetical protein AGDE_13911 [Angomonas deanei]CAD2220927.1 hypothetical protein, conserved [Angomonas deanei]|eukprot:EPY21643.1 hypothetical protein AGDE_13911 [Angomonas deanei]
MVLHEIGQFRLPGLPKQSQSVSVSTRGVIVSAISYTLNTYSPNDKKNNRLSVKDQVHSYICIIEHERPAVQQAPPQCIHLPLKQHINFSKNNNDNTNVDLSDIHAFSLFVSSTGEDVYLLVQLGANRQDKIMNSNQNPQYNKTSTYLYRREVRREPPVDSSLSDEEEDANDNKRKYILNSQGEYVYYVKLPYVIDDRNIDFNVFAPLSTGRPFLSQPGPNAYNDSVTQVLVAGGGGLTGQPSSLLLYTLSPARRSMTLEFCVHFDSFLGSLAIQDLLFPSGDDFSTVLMQCQHTLLRVSLPTIIDLAREELEKQNHNSQSTLYLDASSAICGRYAWDRHAPLTCSTVVQGNQRHILSATESGAVLRWDLLTGTAVSRPLRACDASLDGVSITGVHAPSFTTFYTTTSNGYLVQWEYNSNKVALDAGVPPPSALTDYSAIEIQHRTATSGEENHNSNNNENRFDYTPTLLYGGSSWSTGGVGGEGFQLLCGAGSVLLLTGELGTVTYLDEI